MKSRRRFVEHKKRKKEVLGFVEVSESGRSSMQLAECFKKAL